MRKAKLTGFIFLLALTGWGQQLPQYSQWMTHQFAFNPAHAGIKKCIDFQSLFRYQWTAIDGAPKSGFVTASFPLQSKRKKFLSARHGMGLKFEMDRIGQFNMNRFNFAYAGHFNFTRDTRLSLGVYGGIVQFGFNPSSATTIDPDPQILREASFIVPDAHFGAWWNGVNYYFGLMVNQLIPYKWELGDVSQNRFHVMVNGGYRLKINEQLTLLPGAMAKIPFAGPLAADLNLNLDVNNVFQIGLGYRTQDAIVAYAGFRIKERFSIQYSFDYTTSSLQGISGNTHELSLGFILCERDKKGSSNCPLFE